MAVIAAVAGIGDPRRERVFLRDRHQRCRLQLDKPLSGLLNRSTHLIAPLGPGPVVVTNITQA